MTSMTRTVAYALVVLALASQTPLRPASYPNLTHDAYIWQRKWTTSVDRAITESSKHIRLWRVLGAEMAGEGTLLEFDGSRQAFARLQRPAILVVRINGQIGGWSSMRTARDIMALVDRWRASGVVLKGIEVDHDCGTARLGAYADFLDSLQSLRSAGLSLSITALPDWMHSSRLPSLLHRIDEAVLQVHSVMNPRQGLFDPSIARQWVTKWSRSTRVPFRVSVPTYGSRIDWDETGRVVLVENEVQRFSHRSPATDFFVRPIDVSDFLTVLRREQPPHFDGTVWFRLPTEDDVRSWSMRSWHRVIEGERPVVSISSRVVNSDVAGARSVYVVNDGEVDDELPRTVEVAIEGQCESADAMSPYVIEPLPGHIRFARTVRQFLPIGRSRLIGWIRCNGGRRDIH